MKTTLIVLLVLYAAIFSAGYAAPTNHSSEIEQIYSVLEHMEARIENTIRSKIQDIQEARNHLENQLEEHEKDLDNARQSHIQALTQAEANYEHSIKAAKNELEQRMKIVEQKSAQLNSTKLALENHRKFMENENQNLDVKLEAFTENLEGEIRLIEKIRTILENMYTRKVKKLGEYCDALYACVDGLECESNSCVPAKERFILSQYASTTSVNNYYWRGYTFKVKEPVTVVNLLCDVTTDEFSVAFFEVDNDDVPQRLVTSKQCNSYPSPFKASVEPIELLTNKRYMVAQGAHTDSAPSGRHRRLTNINHDELLSDSIMYIWNPDSVQRNYRWRWTGEPSSLVGKAHSDIDSSRPNVGIDYRRR